VYVLGTVLSTLVAGGSRKKGMIDGIEVSDVLQFTLVTVDDTLSRFDTLATFTSFPFIRVRILLLKNYSISFTE